MFSVFKKRGWGQKGFTLIELMIVMLILGILFGIAIPIYNTAVGLTADIADDSNMKILNGAANSALAVLGKPKDPGVIWTGMLDGSAANVLNDNLASFAWEEWIQNPFPQIPEGADGHGVKVYKVMMENDGKVTIDKIIPNL